MKLSDTLKNALAVYTGRNVKSIKVCPDPKVDRTYAARAVMADNGQVVDFLVVAGQLEKPLHRYTPDEVADLIEECQFEAWPPPVGKLRFFW